MYRRIIILFLLLIFIICIAICPKISNIEDNKEISVEIKGEVYEEQILKIPLGSNIQDLINMIQLTDNADLSQLSYLDILHNNQIIVIPSKSCEDKISINSANLYELSVLPGVGKSTAIKIIEYRSKNGGFHRLEDLKNISGIGDKKYEKIKPYICL